MGLFPIGPTDAQPLGGAALAETKMDARRIKAHETAAQLDLAGLGGAHCGSRRHFQGDTGANGGAVATVIFQLHHQPGLLAIVAP